MPIQVYAGLDGEGTGRNPHKYTLLACAPEDGKAVYVERESGLKTKECLEFLIELDHISPVVFTYSFGYDITKIVEEMTNEEIYRLLRPETRVIKRGFKPIEWEGFKVHWVSGKLVVAKGGRRITIWDLFKFYQSSFVKALIKWQVGSDDERSEIQRMKDKREDFKELTPTEIREYCFSECRKLGTLAHKLVDAHETAGLDLSQFFGAGSTASLILEKMGIHDRRKDPPKQIKGAVMRAFFGGRFENSRVGDINGPLYNFDISSAYPYQLFRMPCLAHGTWRATTSEKEARQARIALVWWQLGNVDTPMAWGPFPFRTVKGSILFPSSGGQGWVWGEEFFAGKDIFPNVRFKMAYTYNTECKCRPFEDIPFFYRERCRIGKDGAGIVLKLGPNACYGKIAQSIGNPRFANWVWAGLITSNTRAQILRALGIHHEYLNLVITATDGIYTLEDVKLEAPEDTGTSDLEKPLGGWERSVIENGIFSARPGVNIPLDIIGKPEPTEKEIDKVRGRGFGRKALFQNAAMIRESWLKHKDRRKVLLPNISRFYGAKTSIWKVGDYYKRADEYGTWFSYEPFLSFTPLPKRAKINKDNTLQTHRLIGEAMSAPYKADIDVNHALGFVEAIAEEQPA